MRRIPAVAQGDGLPVSFRVAAFLVTAMALISRCPSMFTRAQFYAEDGFSFYAQAYHSGWLHSVLVPQAGYLCLVQRLGAGLSLLAPFQFAPLVMAVVGLSVQALLVVILLGPRCRKWGPLPLRMVYAAIYVAIPCAQEVHVVLTNAQWNLALALLLLAFADPPPTRAGKAGDGLLFLLGGLSGPFGTLLLPLVLVFWWLRRGRWYLVVSGILSLTSAAQVALLLHGGSRSVGPLGARPVLLVRILGRDIIAGAVLGSHFRTVPAQTRMLWVVPAAVLGLVIYAYCIMKAPLRLRLFTLYCLALLAVSLRSPVVNSPHSHWLVLLATTQSRYWYFPMLAFLWGAAWCALCARARIVSVVGGCVLCLLVVGMVENWRYRPYVDEHFALYAERLQAAPAGALVVIPITPEGRRMELVKH
jgi:hypothetical protein